MVGVIAVVATSGAAAPLFAEIVAAGPAIAATAGVASESAIITSTIALGTTGAAAGTAASVASAAGACAATSGAVSSVVVGGVAAAGVTQAGVASGLAAIASGPVGWLAIGVQSDQSRRVHLEENISSVESAVGWTVDPSVITIIPEHVPDDGLSWTCYQQVLSKNHPLVHAADGKVSVKDVLLSGDVISAYVTELGVLKLTNSEGMEFALSPVVRVANDDTYRVIGMHAALCEV